MALMVSETVGAQISAAVPAEDVRMAAVMAKYSKFMDYQPDERTQAVLLDANHCVDRYTNDDFLDHLLNAEAYRQKDQLAFNNTILYQFDVPWGDQAFSVALRNSDLGKLLFVGLEWGIEWYLYRHILSWWCDVVVTLLMQHRKEYVEALQTIQSSLKKGDDQALEKAVAQVHNLVFTASSRELLGQLTRDLLPVAATYLCLSHTFEALKKYYLLDRSYAQNILMLAATSLLGIKKLNKGEPISVFELIEGNWISGMPLTILRTGMLEQVNGFLQRCGVLPAWSSGTMYLFTRRVVFWILFMRWSITSFLQPRLFEIIMNDHQEVLKKLQSTSDSQSLAANITQDQKELKKTMKDGYASTFPLWLAFKAEKYSSWQTMINLVIMVPAVVCLARKIYMMVQKGNAQNAAGNPIVGVDKGMAL